MVGTMNINIKYKLSLILILTILLIIFIHFLFIQWSFDKKFHDFMQDMDHSRLQRLSDVIENEYAIHGSWVFIKKNPRVMKKIMFFDSPESSNFSDPFEQNRRKEDFVKFKKHDKFDFMFENRVVLIDESRKVLFKRTMLKKFSEEIVLNFNGAIIGYLKIGLMPKMKDLNRSKYIQTQRNSFAIISLFSILLSIFLIIYLSGKIVKPVKLLSNFVMRLSSGDYKAMLEITSKDEFGKLSRDLNFLGKTLAQNEQTRRQWVADISHELRTPVSVLRSNIEAVQDGVRDNSDKSLALMHGEVMHLKGLIDDLYELSLSDVGGLSYRMDKVCLTELLQNIVNSYTEHFAEKGIELSEFVSGEKNIFIHGDLKRLTQMWNNLFENSLKYTNIGGIVHLSAKSEGDFIIVRLNDSFPGVPIEHFDKLFNRFYRVDNSRNRATGGAGLGLSIVKNIADAHGAAIDACQSDLGGLCIVVKFKII